MPLVGGELALAALEHGFEEYGVQQLLKYEELTRNNETYLWYFPNGKPASRETSTSPDASPTDGWGSSAMLYALIEGLAGVVDLGILFRRLRLSPRWIAAGRNEARVSCAYGPSGTSVGYTYEHRPGERTFDLEISAQGTVNLHLLLPQGSKATSVRVDGRKVTFTNSRVETSRYVDATFPVRKSCGVRVQYS